MPTKRINIEAEPFQWDFYTASNRFNGFLAGWGTGKTMCGLNKAFYLSQAYNDNLGLIVRSKFTDLRDSTMKDFTRYFSRTVPQGTKEIKVANSTVLFRHAKDLSGLQNVNIGWFYIEQAEEFPTEAQFDLLRGRLRRVLTPQPNIQEQLTRTISNITGLPALKEVVDNWVILTKDAINKDGNKIPHPDLIKEGKMLSERDVAEMVLTEQLGITLRQGMIIANANGHNWVWKKFVKSPQKGYSCVEANSFQNLDHIPADTLADWKVLEVESPGKYKQYVMNCHDEVDLDACYYADSLNQLRKRGQIGVVHHDPSLRVNLAFDVGFDCTAVWFFQLPGQKVNVIDYYENTGKPIKHYVEVFDRRKRDLGYAYGKSVMPHDSNKREMVAGTTLSKSLKDMDYDVLALKRVQNLDFAINNVINILPRCWFDEKKCELGLEALNHYRREYNEELKIYLEKPLHDWASHPASSFKELAEAVSKGLCGTTRSVSVEDIAKWSRKYRRTG